MDVSCLDDFHPQNVN
uniref:Uncharacterized protein n=1 Tax=Anguilla anguilla TaxID=7936 RepID=A0A0E9UQX9_ANGAN